MAPCANVQFPFLGGKFRIRLAAYDPLAFMRRSSNKNNVLVNPCIIADENRSRVDELNAHVNVHALPYPAQKVAPNQPAQPVAGRSRNVLHWKQENPGQFIEKKLESPHGRPLQCCEHRRSFSARLVCRLARSVPAGLNQNLLDALEVVFPGIVLELFKWWAGRVV